MSDTINIYGQKVELTPPGDGYITDVIILARQIQYAPDGTMEDAILISTTPNSTYIMQRGIIETARDELRDTE